MCSKEGIINVLRRVVEDRVRKLEDLYGRKNMVDSSIVTMEEDQIRDIARLKELEDDDKRA